MNMLDDWAGVGRIIIEVESRASQEEPMPNSFERGQATISMKDLAEKEDRMKTSFGGQVLEIPIGFRFMSSYSRFKFLVTLEFV